MPDYAAARQPIRRGGALIGAMHARKGAPDCWQRQPARRYRLDPSPIPFPAIASRLARGRAAAPA